MKCIECGGRGEVLEYGLCCVEGDTSYEYIPCERCGGAGLEPLWALLDNDGNDGLEANREALLDCGPDEACVELAYLDDTYLGA